MARPQIAAFIVLSALLSFVPATDSPRKRSSHDDKQTINNILLALKARTYLAPL